MNTEAIVNATLEYVTFHDDTTNTLGDIRMAHARFLVLVRKARHEAPAP